MNDASTSCGPPPGTLRVIYLVARMSGRRALHRMGDVWRRRPAPGERGATARKQAAGRWVLPCLVLLGVWQTVSVTTRVLHGVALWAEQRAQPEVVIVQEHQLELLEHSLELFIDAVTRELPDGAERETRRAELRRSYEQRGLSGFRQSALPSRSLWPSPELWPASADPDTMSKPLALFCTLLALSQILRHVARGDDDLARVGPGLEWLFSFPVRARALFLARALSAVFAPLAWVVLFPFYAVVFGSSGYGWLGVPLALAVVLYVAALGGGLRVLLETSLRRALSVAWVSRVQALLSTLSVLPLFAAYAVAFSPRAEGLFSWLVGLPRALFYTPLALPVWLAAGGAAAWLSGLALWVVLGAWLALAVGVAERRVQTGITSGTGERTAARADVGLAMSRRRASPLRGALLKEWRCLLRDRRSRAQAFLAPVLVLGLQLWLNPSLLKALASNPRHAATAAFAVAGFSLSTGACSTLAAEGPALWLLYTAPRRLERLLLDKLWAWASVAGLFALLTLVIVWSVNPALIWPSLPYAALAFAGVGLYSLIALGIGALGTDVLEPEPFRRQRFGSVYLFMLLAGLFGYSIYMPSWWAKLVQLVLSALLAFALWQKLRDQLPYMLDPTAAPAPAIGVADGVIAALAFFVLQGLLTSILQRGGMAPARALSLSFVGAGCAVAGVSLVFFQRSRVPHLSRALGLTRPAAGRGGRVRQLGLGVAAGFVAACVGLGYLALARHVPWIARELEEATRSMGELDLDARLSLLMLAVLAAPLFEEFIFRGILYRGFRRSTGAPLACVASALVFALMHPGVTALPIFVMAVLAALAYERTGWLATPIAAHMTYNAIVVGGALF